jgi:aminoglycoside phosphotransferase (APT) family kinase protein
LTAVIDFGCVGIGDPAVDLLPAWALLIAQTRRLFRAANPIRAANPVLAASGWRRITEVIADRAGQPFRECSGSVE